MKDEVKLACQRKVQTIPLERILPIRKLNPISKRNTKYQQIASSVREVGIIEPLVVHPQTGKTDEYLLLDGHLRLEVLKDLGAESTECLVALDDEAFTYNHKVNRLTPIQEHFMILKAIENGVSEEDIAKALNVHIDTIRRKRDLLVGICPEAVELLRGKAAPQGMFAALRKAKPMRQIEMLELMASANNYSAAYAQCLVAATPEDQLVVKSINKQVAGLKPTDIARMEREMTTLEKDLRRVEKTHGTNTLQLVLVVGYLRKLLGNTRVKEFLSSSYPDMLGELEQLVESQTLETARE